MFLGLYFKYNNKIYIIGIGPCLCCSLGHLYILDKTKFRIYNEKCKNNPKCNSIVFKSECFAIGKPFFDYLKEVKTCPCREPRLGEYLQNYDRKHASDVKISDIDLNNAVTLDDCENVSVDKSKNEKIYITNSMTSKELNKLLRSSFGR